MFPKDANEPQVITWLRNPRVRRTMILLALWAFIALILINFRFVLLPFGLAILMAFILAPAVAFLSRLKVKGRSASRAVVVIALYIVGLVAFGTFGTWALAQIGRELSGLGNVTRTLIDSSQTLTAQALDWTVNFAERNAIPIDRTELQGYVDDATTGLLEEGTSHLGNLAGLARDLVGGTFRAVFGLFLVLMLCAFMSIDSQKIERYVRSLVPPENQVTYGILLDGILLGLAGVVRGQVLICVTNGVLTFVGLWLLDVKLPLILATLAMVFSLIPIFGSILSTLPIAAMALTDSLAKGLFAILWIIGIHLLEANVLNPKIMGDAAKIHPLVVVFVLIVGEQTAGLIGALFAVPIAAVVLTVFKFLHRRALETQAASEDLPKLA